MAKKSLGIPNPFTGGTVYDPSIATQADLYSNVYNQSYNNNRKNPAMAALLGALTLNPAMVVAAPMLANKKNKKLESQYQAGLINVFDDLAKQGASMNAIQQDQQVQNQGQDIIEALRQANQVDPNFPNLVNRQLPPMEGQPAPPKQYVPGMKMADLEKLLNGATGAYNADYGIERLDQVESNKFAGASGIQQPAQLQGGIKSSTQKPIWFPYAEQMFSNGASVMNNARQYGESNKQFTQEFPGKDAKNKAEAAYLNSQRGVQNAKLAEQLITNQNLPKSIAADNEVKTKQAKKIDTEIAQLALKPYDDYTAAGNIVEANTDALKKLGLINATGVFDQNKLQSLDAGQQGKAIELQRQLQIARSNQIAAGEKIKKIEGVSSQGKQTPGSKTLEMTAPQGQESFKQTSDGKVRFRLR